MLIKEKGTSETTRENIIKFISIHKPNHKYPNNDQEFGYYLAGIIDGNGFIYPQPKLVIYFHYKDTPLAYYLKNYIKYGVVETKNKQTTLTFTNQLSLLKIANLIHNKLKFTNKIALFNNLTNYFNFKFLINQENILNNYYLAGLIDSKGKFTIDLVKDKLNLNLNLEFDPLDKDLITSFLDLIGGEIKEISDKIVSYNSLSIDNMYKIIGYLDKFSVNSQYKEYVYLRKTYIIIQNQKHNTEEGLIKIKEYQERMKKFIK